MPFASSPSAATLHRPARRVAVLIQIATGFGRDIRRGIGQYAQTRGGWAFHALSGGPFLRVGDLHDWEGHGVIAMVGDERRRDELLDAGLVVVNISSRMAAPGLPSVLCDNHAIGRLAAEHLLERGFRHLAFYGYPADYTHSEHRHDAFAATAAEAGVAVDHRRVAGWSIADQARAVADWIESLPTPVGVFAVNDELAKVVADVCWERGLMVPEQVAILGADNDVPLLEMCNPGVSSLDIDGVRVGFEAAALLDRLLAGDAAPDAAVLIPPRGVVTRRSTDVLAVQDPHVAAALRTIREHADLPITVAEVVAGLPVSRRAFEQRFKAAVGRTPWQEIRRAQVERVKMLLRETDLPVQRITELSAFCDPRRLCTVFREETGGTPTAYRKRFREQT